MSTAPGDDDASGEFWRSTFAEPSSKANGAAPADDKTAQRGKLFGRLLVFSMTDLDSAKKRSYLLKGVISPGEISVWVGPPKCGKSFLLMYVAYMLALGRSVFGLRVKPSRVLYVAAEGEGGINKRLIALRERYGEAENFHWTAQPIDLLRDDKDGGHKAEVIEAAFAVDAQLIVVDTLNRALAGGDENRSDDMGALIGHVSDIKLQTGAHVALIHHGTKASNGANPRGHGSLIAADDVLVEVQKLDTGDRSATLVHSKDDADGMRWGFKLEPVSVGIDDDGDPITTLIVCETDKPPKAEETKPAKPSAGEQVALNILDRAMKEGAGTTATVGPEHEERPVLSEFVWRQRYYAEARQGDEQETKRQAFVRAMTSLQAKNLIAARDGFVWRPNVW